MTGSRSRFCLFVIGAVVACCWSGAALADSHMEEEAAEASTAQSEAAARQAARKAASGVVDEITISARKREESLQNVPISVTAFGADQIDKQMIDDANDIQFKVPNFQFNKTNFTGTNLQIRGIGSAVVAASGEAAVGIHLNTIPLAPRLFEQEFFDIERIEILRGPQGTLFGRNSTGGTFNVWTKKPTRDFESEAELEYGNFSSVKGRGAVNIPINDRVRTRFAGMFHDRDGYLTNNFTNNNIDSRWLYGLRGSVEVEVTDTTTANLMVSWFDENDSRSRIGKQLCKKDANAFPFSIGCADGPLEFGTITSHSTLGGILETVALTNPAGLGALGGVGLYPTGLDTQANSVNPPDLRQHDSTFDPDYNVDEFIATFELTEQFVEDHTFSWVTGYQRTRVDSMQDYTMARPAIPFTEASVDSLLANANWTGALTPNDVANPTGFCFDDFGEGIGCHDRSFSFDQSLLDMTLISTEMRVVSDRDSDFNYTAGAIYSYASAETDYKVYFSGAEVIGRISRTLAGGAYDPDLFHFNTESKPAITNSFGLFGEVYYDITDDLKFTLGARYTYDRKKVRSRQNLLNASGVKTPFDKRDADWHAGTGRVTIDYNFENDYTDQTLFYVSASRGYKPGGFNPAVDPMLFPNISETFDPETIWAYEVGTKNRYWDNRIQTNIGGFFYDYRDYQISKIEARTSINENIDAYVWGLEAEFVALPIDNVQIDFSLAWLGSEIQSGSSADPADPTAGDPGFVAVKNLADGSNAVIAVANVGDPLNPANYVDPIEKDLSGRELPNTPDIQLNIGGQYTHDLPWGDSFVTGRIQYYFQTDMYGRMFNETRDKISEWSQADASLRYEEGHGHLFVELWVKNFTDNDDITAHYFTDASSGNFTNVFILEPRTFGITVGGNY